MAQLQNASHASQLLDGEICIQLEVRDLTSPTESFNCIQAAKGALWACSSSSYHSVFAKKPHCHMLRAAKHTLENCVTTLLRESVR